jgi:hypothetical protein
MKNPHAVDREPKFFAEMGRRGGIIRAEKMTKEERSEAAKKAVQARWKKKKYS